MIPFKLRLSGTFEATHGSQKISAFRTAKARALLAYLAVESDIAHPRASLSSLLWPQLNTKAAGANLRNTLSNLRQLFAPIPELLTITRYTVEFHSQLAFVDVVELLRNVTADNVDLYQGDFLAGLSFSDALPFEEWRVMLQERLHLTLLLALDRLVKEKLAAHDFPRALSLVQKQLTMEAWHEKAHFQLITILYHQGQRDVAVQQYDNYVTVLENELGIAPSPEMRALIAQIENGPAVSSMSMPQTKPIKLPNLPRQNSPFVGRDNELSRLLNQLLQPEGPILTILGAGGIGKTRLAVEAATQLIESDANPYVDGVYFVPLAPIDDARTIPLAVGEAIGYKFHEEELLLTQLFRHISNKRLLLIFDNLEHLIEDSRHIVYELVTQLPRCHIMVTSRQKLSLAGEVVFELQGLSLRDHTDRSEQSDAERLFSIAVKRVGGSVILSPSEMEAVVRICAVVEGNPLAIVLAAAWMDVLSATDIADQIEKDVDLLASEQLDAPARQRSMRATFNYSWELLDPELRQAYVQLAVFRGGFSRSAAEKVGETTIRQLARLCTKSLLIYDAVRNRYHIHRVLRQVCEEKLGGMGAEFESQTRSAHSDYYLNEVAKLEGSFFGAAQQATIKKITGDYANIRAAWLWAVKHKRTELLHRSLESYFFYSYFSGLEQDGVAEMENALHSLLKENETDQQIRFLCGRIQNRVFELTHLYRPVNGSQLNTLQAIFDQQNDPTELALLMNRRANLALQNRDVPTALELYQRQLKIYQRTGDAFRQISALTNMAQILIIAGQVDAGLHAAEESLKISRAREDRLGIVLALTIIGTYELLWKGDIQSARSRYLQIELLGRDLLQEGRVVTALVISKAYLGFIGAVTGDEAQLTKYVDEVIALGKIKQTPYLNGSVSGLDAIAALAAGHFAKALQIASRGLGYSKRAGAVELNQIAHVTASCILGETNHAIQLLVPLWRYVLRVQNLPERALLFYLLPAALHILIERNQAALALALFASAKNHPMCPISWLEKMVANLNIEARFDRLSVVGQVDRTVVPGAEPSFGELTDKVLVCLEAELAVDEVEEH